MNVIFIFKLVRWKTEGNLTSLSWFHSAHVQYHWSVHSNPKRARGIQTLEMLYLMHQNVSCKQSQTTPAEQNKLTDRHR